MDAAKTRLKRALIVVILADLAIFGTWYTMWSQVPLGSRSWFYQTAYQITVVEHDADFGDTAKEQLVQKFTPGLVDMALPVSAAVTAGALGWLLLGHAKARKRAAAKPV